MKLLRNLFFLFSITLFGLAGTILSLFNYNPFESEINVFLYFYISLLITITGILAIGIFYIKDRYSKTSSQNKLFWPSVRQGLLISISIVTILILKGMKLLDFWVGIPVIISIILLELFFQTNKSKH